MDLHLQWLSWLLGGAGPILKMDILFYFFIYMRSTAEWMEELMDGWKDGWINEIIEDGWMEELYRYR